MKYRVVFTRSEVINFAGNKKQLQKKLREGYRVVHCSRGGNYILQKPGFGHIIQIDDNGKRKIAFPAKFICDHYHKCTACMKDFYDLKKDLESGKVQFKDLFY